MNNVKAVLFVLLINAFGIVNVRSAEFPPADFTTEFPPMDFVSEFPPAD